ncbi:uncharacterized protein LOC127159660 [Labeo rohita]|uniref:uncharacterized protein LOC127159660 n=1 Tax=Labeo rohita TaxID=84645 RepID=UPI0021E22039|nr:uncharacterized protein LOC127159660 [Labeo rohita]
MSQEIEEELGKLQIGEDLQKSEQEESSEEEVPPAVKVGLLNVRSIKNMKEKRRKIKDLITEQNLDVFLLTETWLENDTPDVALEETKPENFDIHQQPREGRGGGVAILFSQELRGERIPFDSTITTFEYVATALRHEEWDEDVLFINVYQPSTYSIENYEIFVGDLDMLLREVFKRYNRIIVAGDFNVHFEDPSNAKKKTLEAACMSSFVQNVKKPTHKKGGSLDLVFSRNVKVKIVDIRDDGISDHFTVYFSVRPRSKANPLVWASK